MSVHRIRLHGPWTIRADDPGEGERPDRMVVPGLIQDSGFTGRVSLIRHFGRPTNLDADERVWLVLDRVVGLEHIFINGKNFPIETPDFDMTECLQAHNEVELVFKSGDGSAGIPGEVRLEIRKQDRV